MKTRGCVAVALALWLAWSAFSAVPVAALPNHVVAGGVFGPGGDVSPAPSNPANVAGAVFYSTSQPTYPLLVGADAYNPADGTDPATFAADVGAAWEWSAGDTVVVVLETIRGVGGWTGPNYTTSLDGILQTGSPSQDLGDGTLEGLPTLVLTPGPDWIRVAWTPLTDANGNVVSYRVYTGPAPGGPFSFAGSVNQGPSPSFNSTSLSAGRHCYNLAVGYERDLIGGVYETTGRSEPVCAVVSGTPPEIVSTSPSAGAVDVLANAPIVVEFSEAIETSTFAWTIFPSLSLTDAWSPGDTVVTLTHGVDFTDCTSYTVEITTARDLDTNDLVAGSVSNPWTFSTTCPSPYIVTTTPANNAVQVSRGSPVVIRFSKAMSTGSVVVDFAPVVSVSACVWTVVDTVCTITPTPAFAGGTQYQVTVSGTDTGGNPIVPGPVPNPWVFTTNTPPSAQLTAPGVGVCRTGGWDLDITWTMGDAPSETPVGSLRVWLNYTDGVNTFPIAGVQGTTGHASPETFAWTTPLIDGNVQILLVVIDGARDSAQDLSASVEIDSTPPTVLMTSPTPGATGVALTANIVLTFSEAMSLTPTAAAVFATPTIALTPSWTVSDTVLTLSHAPFAPDTLYTVTVGTGAVDACTPGSPLGSQYVATFRTGPPMKVPNPPSNLRVASQSPTAIGLAWNAPTQYTDGSNLPLSEITEFKVFRATTQTGARAEIATTVATTYTDTNVTAGTLYFYWVKAVSVGGGESDFSQPASARAETPGLAFDWLWILIIVVIALAIVGAVLLLRRKKPTPARAPPEEVAPQADEPIADEYGESPPPSR